MDEKQPIASHPTDPASKKVQPPERADFWSFAAELVKTAVIISFIAYVLRIFVLQPFIVEGLSMYPQFETHDYLLVDKVSYRLHEPARGDIIVFKYPGNTSINYVKRIIGMPGERVHIESGKVTIFNSGHPDGVTLDEPYVEAGNKTLTPSGAIADYSVSDDTYFVLGDNRQASSDSREWGLLPKVDIIGRVLLQAFPLNHFSLIPHARYGE